VTALEKFSLETVIHCGDIGGPEVLPLFDSWRTHFVFGNSDHYFEGVLTHCIEDAGQICHGEFGSLEIEGRKIAFLHSHDQFRFRATIKSQEWDLVCYGHTHIAEERKEGKTLVLNPGAVYRAIPRSIAIVTLPSLEIEFVNLS
jgi:putative phosphoesterase